MSPVTRIDHCLSTRDGRLFIEAYAEACTRTLRRELPRHGIDTDGLMLQLEPGRAIHGNAGIHLTTVTNIKRIREPIRWNQIIVDTTEFWLTGGRYEHHLHHTVFANKTDAPMVDKADVIGRSCYADRLLPTVTIPISRSATSSPCSTPVPTRRYP
jgi:diaminopimelate decarboxylase